MLVPILVERRMYECEVCHKEFKRRDHLKTHNNAIHLGVKYPCNKCEHKATNPSDLRKHIRSQHDGTKVSVERRIYECGVCYKVFKRGDHLKTHNNAIHLGVKYPCDKCEHKATNSGNLRKHIRSKHDGTKVSLQRRINKCGICYKEFTKGSHLKTHNDNVHLGVRYPCDKCEYKATNPANLRTHIRSKHDGIKVPCDQCDFKAANRSSVLKHKQAIHLGLKPHACILCDYKASMKATLRSHVNRQHNETKELFQCSECNYKTAINCDFRKHKQGHGKIKDILSCDLCSYKTSYIEHLKDHKRRVHRQEKVECKFCDFSSVSRHLIYIHKQRKHVAKSYQCDRCDHVAEDSNKLTSHKRRAHKMQKEFPCKICTNVYKQKAALKMHVDRLHSGGAKTDFNCDICAKVFTQKRILAVHIKFAHNVKKVACDQCDRTFSKGSSLFYHKNVKHKGRTFQCNTCSDKLTTKVNLTKHIESKHMSDLSKEEAFACKICTWKTYSQAKFETHAKYFHVPKRRINCELCNKVLANSRSLSKHLKNHSKTGTAFHKCSICSFYSPNKRHLKKHSNNAHGDSHLQKVTLKPTKSCNEYNVSFKEGEITSAQNLPMQQVHNITN